jgi:hypothetical protein
MNLALDDALIIYFRIDLIYITHKVMISVVVVVVIEAVDVEADDVVVVVIEVVVVEVDVVVLLVAVDDVSVEMDVVDVEVTDVDVVVVEVVIVVVEVSVVIVEVDDVVAVVVLQISGEDITMNVTQYAVDCTSSLFRRKKSLVTTTKIENKITQCKRSRTIVVAQVGLPVVSK